MTKSVAISHHPWVISQQPTRLTIDKAVVQPESDKVCATVLHLLPVVFTGTGLTLGNLILMVWEDLQVYRRSIQCVMHITFSKQAAAMVLAKIPATGLSLQYFS